MTCGKPLFRDDAPWNQRVDESAVDAQSDEIIGLLSTTGWDLGRMQIDFSIEVMCASDDTPFREFEPTEDFYAPDCDQEPVPIPEGGALEGEEGYACTNDGNCQLIVIHRPTAKLYEQWRADIEGETYRGGCLAVWDLDSDLPDDLRGEGCTSADAAGLPIAALLFDAGEVAAGEIRHAIRFILPNDRIRNRTCVRPASHATGAASGGLDAPPYGTRLRLRADYPLASLPNAGARVVATAMQRYGIVLADGGSVTLTAQSDRFTEAKWDALLGPHDLEDITPGDFEMVDAGERFDWTGDCER